MKIKILILIIWIPTKTYYFLNKLNKKMHNLNTYYILFMGLNPISIVQIIRIYNSFINSLLIMGLLYNNM